MSAVSLVDFLIITAPSAVYAPQIVKLYREEEVKGFRWLPWVCLPLTLPSIGVPLLLLLANVIKIHFWCARFGGRRVRTDTAPGLGSCSPRCSCCSLFLPLRCSRCCSGCVSGVTSSWLRNLTSRRFGPSRGLLLYGRRRVHGNDVCARPRQVAAADAGLVFWFLVFASALSFMTLHLSDYSWSGFFRARAEE